MDPEEDREAHCACLAWHDFSENSETGELDLDDFLDYYARICPGNSVALISNILKYTVAEHCVDVFKALCSE